MDRRYSKGLLLLLLLSFFNSQQSWSAPAAPGTLHWVRIKAIDKFERTAIENTGVHIEFTDSDSVTAIANDRALAKLKALGHVEVSFIYNPVKMDFPSEDSKFHTYAQVNLALKNLADKNPSLVRMESIGKSVQGRDIFNLHISTDVANSGNKPAILYLGTHHAREHVSTEVPLLLAQYLIDHYNQGDQRIVRLLAGRDIHIIPLVNPDGSEYDTTNNEYQMWRKNRADNHDGTFGVDLNRNYGYGWGGEGASTDTSDETYRGPAAFSEPETRAVKAFVESHKNINVLLSFHTFSELILYPFGGSYDPIADQNARRTHEIMAQTMAKWNGYKPEQASDLYIATGDTTDWAWGEHKIISFTFELDPSSKSVNPFDPGAGFYPGQAAIPTVFQKNLEPCLYLLEYADNPYRVLSPTMDFGLQTDLLNITQVNR